jgi:type II secretory pathway pseudopilin PulG
MKTPFLPFSSRQGLTAIELLTVLGLIAIAVVLFIPTNCRIPSKARLSAQVSNGKNIFTSMANYAAENEYPLYCDKNDPSTKINNSNEAFAILLKGGYLDDKKVLFQNGSAWCKKAVNSEATAKQVLPGENDWCYVAGLNHKTAHANWPILANAFSPGTTHYVTDVAKKGGEWKGTRAVVIYAGGHAEIVETLEKASHYIVRRPDKVQEDAFVPEGEWLSGPEVKVLFPKGS